MYHIQLGLGIAAAGYDSNQGIRLFQESFERAVRERINAVLEVDQYGSSRGVLEWETTQESRTIEIRPGHRMGDWWSIRVDRDGSIGVQWRQEVTATHIETLVEHNVRRAWQIADEIATDLGARDSRYLHLVCGGGMFPAHAGGGSIPGSLLSAFPTVALGALGSGVDGALLARIKRELTRSLKLIAYEPESGDRASSNPA